LPGELAIFPPSASTGPEAPDGLESVKYKIRGTRYKEALPLLESAEGPNRIQGMGSAPRVIPAMHGFAFYCRALLTIGTPGNLSYSRSGALILADG